MGTTGQSITLANSIIGVGILAMPFCFQQCGVLLATLILLVMGLISRLCCYFLLKSALLARRRNFEFLAFHVFGSAGKMAVEVGIIGFLMGTCIAYFVVVGDLGPQIIAKMFNINQSDILRTSIMVIVSLVCVLPLGLLRNVDSLSNVSAATIGFYFCLVIKVIAEAASQLVSGEWHARVLTWRPAGLLQCVPIFSMALFCQTQLFEIFESLPTLSLEKMNVVTKNAINICTGVYFTLGLFGYIAFSGHEISGNILMSLSPTMASDVIKLGFVMSLAFSFPLIIFPCRASLYSFLYKKVHSSHHDHIINHSIPEATFRCITVSIIAVALFISLLIPNIELVLGLVGSTIGVLICVVFPAACFVNVTFKDTNERVLAKGVLVLGLIIMVLGTYANLEAAGETSNKVERVDDKYTQDRIDQIVQDFFDKQNKDDVFLKPDKSDPLPLDSHKAILNKDIKKDSEVQPPNPVPPESHSNEKILETKVEIPKLEDKKIVPMPIVQDILDKVSESHPKNLKTKLEAKMNGISKTEAEKPKEPKPQSNEDKIDIIKQQKLIETIKQHGEEQKELMKEQKEILDEIIKTKKELQQNKNEAETNEAKKIAVESIKQIANMAIQSLGGVSEKPDQVDEKKADRLEKLTHEAVQEIAKKAVETIEAIQEIKENPDQANAAKDKVQNNVPPQPVDQNMNPQGNPQNIQPPVQNVQPPMSQQNIQPQTNQQNAPPQVNSQNIQQQGNLQNSQQQAHSQNGQQPNAPQNVQPQNVQQQVNSQNVQQVNSQNVQQVNSQNVQQQVNSQNAQPQNIPQNIPPPLVNSQNVKREVQPNIQPQIVPQNIQPPPANVQQPQAVNNAPVQNANIETPNAAANIPQNIAPQVNNEANLVKEDKAQAQVQNPQDTAQNPGDVKPHSHSPDEPQSYKQGEDAQGKKPDSKIRQDVPLALAMNDLLSSKQIQEKEAVAEQLNEDINKGNAAKAPDNVQPNVIRQKREVVDCTQKVALEPKDREICDTLVDRPKNINADALPPVDMNEVALPKELPMDTGLLHHIGRSLKNYEKDER